MTAGINDRLRAGGMAVDVAGVRARLASVRRAANAAAVRGRRRPWSWQGAWDALPAVVRARDSRAARISAAMGGTGRALRALAASGRAVLSGAEHSAARKDLLLVLYGSGQRFGEARAFLQASWPGEGEEAVTASQAAELIDIAKHMAS
ncbi:hypothetical protein FJY94_08545 [Candidatus Kaiserbacteria bacterium]|nr:hypothetical protein [Candidatus Kaiserbacteria bacterium]